MTKVPDDELIITIDDIRKAGHCVKGARLWFGARGIDFKRVLPKGGGVPASELLAQDDEQARQVVNNKRQRLGENG